MLTKSNYSMLKMYNFHQYKYFRHLQLKISFGNFGFKGIKKKTIQRNKG